jgi:hypothetical protein
MCEYMSMIAMRGGDILCFPGIDSHAEILELAKLDDSVDLLSRYIAKLELVPPQGDHSAPVNQWQYTVDEATEPDWCDAGTERACRSAARKRLKIESGKYCVVYADGEKVWHWAGERHREDGPASEHANGEKIWYWAGKLHRADGPAVERANGEKVWYWAGERHREDGPAVEYANGDKAWYWAGKLHRDDGPVVEYANHK